jgi:hypothetical protein
VSLLSFGNNRSISLRTPFDRGCLGRNVLNQIVLKEHTVQPGPYRVADYKSFAIGDTDITAKAASCNFGYELIDYLDRYFAGWKLIRRVVELPGSYTPYKRVTYLVEVGSDADVETIRSPLRKGLVPCLNM